MFWLICVWVSIGTSQDNLSRFAGENLQYDILWKGTRVAKIDANVSFVENDSSRMSVTFKVQTIGWAEFIFDELDSVYTEFNSSSGELIYSYRFARWAFLAGAPNLDTTYVTKNGQLMTYRFSRLGKESWQKSVVVDSNFSPVDLGDIFSSGMVLRTLINNVGDSYYFTMLGAEKRKLVPKLFPLHVKSEEQITIDGIQYETFKCHFDIVDVSVVFQDPKVIIWATSDYRRLPVQMSLMVTVPILGKEKVKVVLNHEKSSLPLYK